jgi:hypothetical protein
VRTGLFLIPILTAGLCLSQVPEHYLAITLPESVRSENVFIRYILAGEELGGWVQPRPGVSSYVISTTREGQSATQIKAVLYAPGCAIQTLDLPLSNTNNPRYPFVCFSLANVRIGGKLIQTTRFSGREVKLQAEYIARWAGEFLGLPAGIPLTIPVGDVAYPSAGNSFQLSVPDLSRDPLAGSGEIQILAKDIGTGENINQLVPAGEQTFKTRMGGLKIQRAYPAEIIFAPCGLHLPHALIDRQGFSLREFSDPCDR